MVIDPQRQGILRRIIASLTKPFLSRIWYVGVPVVLFVRANQSMCLHTLKAASKPKVNQLHLRKLYADGRRYFIQPVQGGFRLTTTSKVLWHYRKRTSSATVVTARFSAFGEGVTRIDLRGRINPLALLTNVSILLPLFMTSILIYVPWHPLFIVLTLAVLYVLAWASHRSNVHLEVHEMIWFVQTALEELIPTDIMPLGDKTADIVYEGEEFEAAWERFYEEHRSS